MNFVDLPTENKDAIISSGVSFIRQITDAYGADEGMKLWDTIANTLDPEVKGQIFIAMLTGKFTGLIIQKFNSTIDKVSIIRAIRQFDKRSLGLKEAIDLWKKVEAGEPQSIQINLQKFSVDHVRIILESFGCVMI